MGLPSFTLAPVTVRTMPCRIHFLFLCLLLHASPLTINRERYYISLYIQLGLYTARHLLQAHIVNQFFLNIFFNVDLDDSPLYSSYIHDLLGFFLFFFLYNILIMVISGGGSGYRKKSAQISCRSALQLQLNIQLFRYPYTYSIQQRSEQGNV